MLKIKNYSMYLLLVTALAFSSLASGMDADHTQRNAITRINAITNHLTPQAPTSGTLHHGITESGIEYAFYKVATKKENQHASPTVQKQTGLSIEDFNTENDYKKAKQLLKDNWDDLIGYDEPCTEDSCQTVAYYLFKTQRSANYRPHPLIVKTVKNNGQMIGFIGYVLYDSANNDKNYPSGYLLNAPLDAGHIEIMAVDAAYRRTGAGMQLMQHALNDLIQKGAKKINLGVKNDNKPAWNLYLKLGFTIDKKFDDKNTMLVKIIKK